jgi:hypothetical protein
MQTIWLGVDPRPPVARVLAMAGPREPILKARLCPQPQHPRALATLVEAVALWQGMPVRAALAVGDEEPWCDMGRFHVGFDDYGRSPLYTLECVPRLRPPRRGDALAGMGAFEDLRQLLLFEVAR